MSHNNQTYFGWRGSPAATSLRTGSQTTATDLSRLFKATSINESEAPVTFDHSKPPTAADLPPQLLKTAFPAAEAIAKYSLTAVPLILTYMFNHWVHLLDFRLYGSSQGVGDFCMANFKGDSSSFAAIVSLLCSGGIGRKTTQSSNVFIDYRYAWDYLTPGALKKWVKELTSRQGQSDSQQTKINYLIRRFGERFDSLTEKAAMSSKLSTVASASIFASSTSSVRPDATIDTSSGSTIVESRQIYREKEWYVALRWFLSNAKRIIIAVYATTPEDSDKIVGTPWLLFKKPESPIPTHPDYSEKDKLRSEWHKNCKSIGGYPLNQGCLTIPWEIAEREFRETPKLAQLWFKRLLELGLDAQVELLRQMVQYEKTAVPSRATGSQSFSK